MPSDTDIEEAVRAMTERLSAFSESIGGDKLAPYNSDMATEVRRLVMISMTELDQAIETIEKGLQELIIKSEANKRGGRKSN